MKHMQILKRAWAILWNYKILWIFGIVLALTSASYSGQGSNGGISSGGNGSHSTGSITLPGNLPPELSQWINQANQFFSYGMTAQVVGILVAIIIGLVCLALVIGVILRMANYVSQVALIHMVDHYEGTGEKLSFKQGLRRGWSRSAWRLFLIDLVIFVPFFLVVVALLACAATPAFIGLAAGSAFSFMGIIGTIGLVFLFIFLVLLASLALTLILEMMRRVCVLQDKGVMDSIRLGWRLVQQNLKDIFLMWLILLGIQIAFGLVLIPVGILIALVGVLVGGAIGVAFYFGLHAMTGIIAGVVIGLFILIVLVSIPLLFLRGVLETYLSTSWTLVYREIQPAMPVLAEPAS